MTSTTGPALTTVTPYGRTGGSSRVRVFDWVDHLGLSVDVHDYLGLSTNSPRVLSKRVGAVADAEVRLRLLAHRRPERLLLSKQASPFSRGHVERTLLRRARRGVYDYDDSLLDEVGASRVKRLFAKGRIWRRAVEAADVVIAGNDHLAQQAVDAGAGDRVVVIPSCVEPGRYVRKVDFEIRGAPRAVWIGSASTETHLRSITEALLRVHRSHGLRVTVISSGAAALGDLDRMVDRVAWSPQANDLLSRADVGLMPLPDTAQTRGKCAYKLLQYGAAVLPAVASTVGANRAVVDAGIGVGVETVDEWVDALIALLEAGEADRRAVGERARTGVDAGYSFAAQADRWATAVLG